MRRNSKAMPNQVKTVFMFFNSGLAMAIRVKMFFIIKPRPEVAGVFPMAVSRSCSWVRPWRGCRWFAGSLANR